MFVSRDDIEKAFTSGQIALVARLMDGDNYDRGAIEELQATTRNLRYTCAKLVMLLQEKGILSSEQLVGIFDGNI